LQAKKILVICPERALMAELIPQLSQHLPMTPVIEQTEYPNRKQLIDLLNSHQPGLCFVDVGSDRKTVGLLADIVGHNRAIRVVALLPSNDPDLILTSLRQGAAEFLFRPLTSDQVEPVIQRLSKSDSRGAGARVVGVMPVKGACGASTLASNLAFHWKKFGVTRTLLADMDHSAGTLSFLLKQKSTYSFIDALNRDGGLDADIWRGIVSQVQGVDVLLSPETAANGGELPDPTAMIDFCRQAYENITLDMGSPFGRWNLALAMACDEIVLVTTNELPALRATQRATVYLESEGLDMAKLKLVVNRYSTDVGLSKDAIETALHAKIFHTVPSDYESVQRALVEGKPILPSSSFGKSLSALADRLGAAYQPKDASEGKKKGGWGSIFGSLLGGGKKK
jgi:pilus assembly protein CpaE